jgi:SWI/SNF related-matrix-associated actin-dependent regulator of chromatin subfamily C
MRRSGHKRRRDDDDSEPMDHDDEDSRSQLTPVNIPKGREKDAEFSAPKGQKLVDLDEEAAAARTNTTTDNNGKSEDNGTVIEQTNYIVIPSYASWFDYNAINVIEKKGVPEFFSGLNKSKTPEVYMYIRNFMIDCYRLNPMEYLSATSCRRNLSGDVCAILRVHAFLEQWGLINWQVDPLNIPAPVGPPSTSHFMVLADTPAGITLTNPFPPAYQVHEKKPKTEINDSSENSEKATKENEKANNENGEKMKEEGSVGENGNEKSTGQKVPEIGLRTDLYAKQMASLRAKGAVPGREWTDQETLLLLEGLEMFNDDWNKVSEHVGTRTQDECILWFLQLPLQDPYLEDDKYGGGGALGPLAYQPIPFSQSGNPVMSTVAFLAAAVDPKVAASAAKAALEEYDKMKGEIPQYLINAHARNIETYAKEHNGEINAEIGLPDYSQFENNQQDEAMDTTTTAEKDGISDENKLREKDGEIIGPENQTNELSNKVSEVIQKAAAAALSAAAVKAKHLATMEEKRMRGLVAQLVETQMKKLEHKLKYFEELESMMEKEREALEYQRQQLILERQAFHLDQLRYLEMRAKNDAHNKLAASGTLPATLPPGFEVQIPTPQAQFVATSTVPAPGSKSKSPPRTITVEPKPDNLLDPSSTPQVPLPSNETAKEVPQRPPSQAATPQQPPAVTATPTPQQTLQPPVPAAVAAPPNVQPPPQQQPPSAVPTSQAVVPPHQQPPAVGQQQPMYPPTSQYPGGAPPPQGYPPQGYPPQGHPMPQYGQHPGYQQYPGHPSYAQQPPYYAQPGQTRPPYPQQQYASPQRAPYGNYPPQQQQQPGAPSGFARPQYGAPAPQGYYQNYPPYGYPPQMPPPMDGNMEQQPGSIPPQPHPEAPREQ